ncbi:MAG TPA: murein biosynthesis integral membrane protein MurJ [Protaetiibacter sp.]|nr:murein biosynthesis integral membrane protein MurJ [Protaetiibacter sp.]
MADATVPRSGIGRASAVIASGTLVSRVLGFVNATVLVWVIGAQNPSANAFSLANTLPTNIYALIAGGLTSAVIVPQIVRAARHADGGQAFVSRLLTLTITALLAIGVIATLAAPLLISLYTTDTADGALGPAGLALAVTFAYWCLPQVFFYALYAVLGEVLNARGVFGPFTWAPVANNIVMIGSLVVFANVWGVDPAHRDPAGWTPEQIAVLGGGATLGIVIQALVLVAFWRRTGLRFRPDFRWRGVGLGATGRAAGWTFGMIVITQVTIVVQMNVASLAGPRDPSIAVLNIAWLLFMLPHSILALSVATPFFTRMSAHAEAGRIGDFRDDLSSSLRTILLLVVGGGAAVGAAAIPLAAFFDTDPATVVGISSVLLAYLVGLVPFSAMFVLQRGFFALADTRTPFLIQLIQGATAIGALSIVAVVVAPGRPDAVGVAVAACTTVASFVQAIVLALVLRRRIGGIDGRRVLVRLALFLSAAVVAIAAGVGVLALLGGFEAGFAVADRVSAFMTLSLVGGTVLLVYALTLIAVRVPEARAALTPLRRILGRR